MSPEQCKGDRNLSAKSDLYSLGIVLYELVTGRKPFTADTTVEMFLKHVNEKPVRPGKLVPDLPVWLDNLVMFLLEKEREHRPLDAATVCKLLAEIEEKVSTQQSVGAEVANARRVDRPLREKHLDETDKSLARSLRSPGKKRKKRRTDGGRVAVWLKAGLIATALAAVVGLVVYLSWPGGMDAAYDGVRKANPGEERMQAAAKFLDRFRGDPDPRVAEVRELFKAEKVRDAEETLARRHARENMRNNPQDFDPEAYQAAMLAMDNETAGKLNQAAAHWTLARDRSPVADPGAVTDADLKVVLGWVAEKRIRDIQQALNGLPERLRKQIEDDRVNEVDRQFNDSLDPERFASRALRLQELKDLAKARSEWLELAKSTEKDIAQRVWYLFATSKVAELAVTKDNDDPAVRLKNLSEWIGKLETAGAAVRNDTEARVRRREIRNRCRDVIALYGEETSEPIRAIVERARKLLESLPKENVG
jgi:serine/threonine-protein kinase